MTEICRKLPRERKWLGAGGRHDVALKKAQMLPLYQPFVGVEGEKLVRRKVSFVCRKASIKFEAFAIV